MNTDHRQCHPPAPEGESGWQPFDLPPEFTQRRSFLSANPENDRIRIAYFRRESDLRLFAKAWFGRGAEGPPGHAHGGSIAAVLDEMMGMAAWMAGHPVLAANLNVRFREMLPIGTDATVEAWVERINGRKVMARGRIVDPTSRVPFAEAEGLLITLSPKRLRDFSSAAFGAS